MPISRDKARERVAKALAETRDEYKAIRWDTAWSAIRSLESRAIGDDAAIAEELAARMREASKRPV